MLSGSSSGVEGFARPLERAKLIVSAEDGLRAVEIGVAAEWSAREKRVVEMSEITGPRGRPEL